MRDWYCPNPVAVLYLELHIATLDVLSTCYWNLLGGAESKGQCLGFGVWNFEIAVHGLLITAISHIDKPSYL